ncbi:MAG TPA: glycosyltransferase family 2 protein [Flavobacterium sp.]|nr:glycosyltransferase family 2 protein [Flavobacterium sp.]
MPKFSIIIPLYNKESFVSKSLKSVLNQTFTDYEIIVINDGSTDKSVAVVEQINDKRIKLFHQKNQGVSVARNKGIALAQANYICFLDADDFWHTDFLQKMYELINFYSNEKVFSAAIQIQTKTALMKAYYKLTNKVAKDIYKENYFKGSMEYSIICTSCAVFERSVFTKCGVFDEEIKSGQDVDLWIRIGAEYPVIFLNKILSTYVYDINSLSRNRLYKTEIKLKYSKYKDIEERVPFAKKYLDYNRYSEILTNKLNGNKENVRLLKSQINLKNLRLKQRLLIQLPNFILKILYDLQPLFIKLKLRKTVYK